MVRSRWGKGNGERIYHSKDVKGQRPGKPGDSGGGWVFEQDKPQLDILFAVIHGGGFGPQPAANRKWIDKTMSGSGEKPIWLPKPNPKKIPKPTKKKRSPNIGSITWVETRFVIEFTGTLQTATEPTGPWRDDKSAKSPVYMTPERQRKFFRSR